MTDEEYTIEALTRLCEDQARLIRAYRKRYNPQGEILLDLRDCDEIDKHQEFQSS
jgi:hypothetical protein